jgi:hypothetical protein
VLILTLDSTKTVVNELLCSEVENEMAKTSSNGPSQTTTRVEPWKCLVWVQCPFTLDLGQAIGFQTAVQHGHAAYKKKQLLAYISTRANGAIQSHARRTCDDQALVNPQISGTLWELSCGIRVGLPFFSNRCLQLSERL